MKDPPKNFTSSEKYQEMKRKQNEARAAQRPYDEKCWFECLLKEPLESIRPNESNIHHKSISADKPYDPNIVLKQVLTQCKYHEQNQQKDLARPMLKNGSSTLLRENMAH
eukprot:CAMPEP_0176342906 /NCGR_PEP_ID=MMETSP0126-20121128/3550_1 /TAXON_ID=141414 ORGANISM="Strombidinopsis acuminatum, Strain SPMC142" /NCGR_SAMPLE_ID=MMETSP0126 /ASSEMBLY_ACC=CAM_ASM_000229 /LENGTH=109 /DNA_ID=CAMNT_0017688599 /DNA_START=836 /DNA_END=1165 /DNA_ORIENTATION=+